MCVCVSVCVCTAKIVASHFKPNTSTLNDHRHQFLILSILAFHALADRLVPISIYGGLLTYLVTGVRLEAAFTL